MLDYVKLLEKMGLTFATAERFSKCVKTNKAVKAIQHKTSLEKERHDKANADLQKELDAVRADCRHLITTYYRGDAGCGSYTTCDICGAMVR